MQVSKSIITTLLTEYANDSINNIDLPDTKTLGNSIKDLSLKLISFKDTLGFEECAKNHCKTIFGFASSFSLRKETGIEKFWLKVNSYGRELSARSI